MVQSVEGLKDYSWGLGCFVWRAALRGGNWNNASNARSGFILNLNNLPSNRNINIGFRAALSYCQKLYFYGNADRA
jgi:hypothetical protein